MSEVKWMSWDQSVCIECGKPLNGASDVEVYVSPQARRVWVCSLDCKREHLQGYASLLADEVAL